MRRYLVAGNWKMNGSTAANAELVAGILKGQSSAPDVELLVCPPFSYLAAVAGQIGGAPLALGAQTVSEHEAGAYTGEVAGSMLQELGCRYVIVGHSERRALLRESSEAVAAKFLAAQRFGLTPVLCVGETLEQREAGKTEEVIDEQLQAVLAAADIGAFENAVIAYEPVWAIGTGMTASPEQAQDVHAHIRGVLAVADAAIAEGCRILYGGSVKGDNAAGLFSKPDIDGGLIGGASLKSADFLAIAQAAQSLL